MNMVQKSYATQGGERFSPAEAELVSSKDGWFPMQVFRMDAPALLFHLAFVFFYNGIRQDQIVFALVLLEHVKGLASLEDICMHDRCLVGNVVNTDFLVRMEKKLDDRLRPIGTIPK